MIHKPEKLKCHKQYGVWWFQKIDPDGADDWVTPVYNLYNENGDFVAEFENYESMIHYVETKM